jgi:hypothetical protein
VSGRVRIVGGGLTGILAAFEAHRRGCRDIVLHERFEALGGDARPKAIHGREMRDRPVEFGDPIVEVLTTHGARFETVDSRSGSLGVGADGHRVFTWDFAGPAIDCPAGKVGKPADHSLAARLTAYPPVIAVTLEAYVRWRLEIDPARVHADAALPLAVDRVFPAAADLPALVQARASDPWAEALYGIPSNLDEAATATASLPTGGLIQLFDGLHQALARLGVKVELNRLVSPGELMTEACADETIVWAADPTCLFKPMSLAAPPSLEKCVFTYVFEVDGFDGPCPVQVHNFTAQGAVYRAHLYESGGATLVAAECVREADFKTLPTELRTLLSGFGRLGLGPMVHADVQSRSIPSLAAVEGMTLLRAQLADRFGERFVLGDAFAEDQKAPSAPAFAKAS